MRKLSNTNPMS